METSHTTKRTRIIIWIITIVMSVGFIGSYFLMYMQNKEASSSQTADGSDALASDEMEKANQEAQQKQRVDANAYKPEGDVTKLEITDVVEGTGEAVKAGDTINVHYKGTIASSGKVFDSSYDTGEPLDIPLGGVIKGWQEGIPGMKVGGKRRLVVPSEMGYGATGTFGIPPNADLVFEIELFSVTPAAQ